MQSGKLKAAAMDACEFRCFISEKSDPTTGKTVTICLLVGFQAKLSKDAR